MNWEMIGAIAQIVAAVAVIPSVVYLAVQIRGQNKATRQAAANFLTAQYSDFRKSISDSGDFGTIYLRGIQSFDDLDPVAKLRFGSGLGRLFLLSEGLYRLHFDGTLAPELWRGIERTTADLAAYPGVQGWWSTRKHWYTDDFQAVVERMISEGADRKIYRRYTEPPLHT